MKTDQPIYKFFFYPVWIYILSIAYIIASYFVLAMSNDLLQISIHEDQYFEIVGALGFFFTAILFFISFLLSRRTRGRDFWAWLVSFTFLGLAILFIFGAGEEISWGQRILNFETPESLSEINRQDELNLHNLEVLDGGQFFSVDRLFDIFWFGFTLVLPFTYRFVPFVREFITKRFGQIPPIPHLSIGLLFLFNYFWAKVAKIIFVAGYSYETISLKQAVQEIKESNYALLFLLVGLYFVLIDQQLKRDDSLRL